MLSVQTYEDSQCKAANRNNSMGCFGGNARYPRVVDIVEALEECKVVKIKGTDNMTWVRGGIQATDDNGDIIFEKVDNKQQK